MADPPEEKESNISKLLKSGVLGELAEAAATAVIAKLSTEHTLRESGEEIMKDPDVLKNLDERIKQAQMEANKPLIDSLNRTLGDLNQKIDQVAATATSAEARAAEAARNASSQPPEPVQRAEKAAEVAKEAAKDADSAAKEAGKKEKSLLRRWWEGDDDDKDKDGLLLIR
jgi:uncharacterized phage infection (PIP) family protein YhgE